MGHGPLWDRMDAQPRLRASVLRAIDVPTSPGVYAWYRRGRAVYVGKANGLRDRAWTSHLGQSRTLGRSAFRRNVAEHLGFGAANDIKEKRVRPTPEQLAEVRAWIVGCSVAWIECETGAAAKRLEGDMKLEWLPPLTRQ